MGAGLLSEISLRNLTDSELIRLCGDSPEPVVAEFARRLENPSEIRFRLLQELSREVRLCRVLLESLAEGGAPLQARLRDIGDQLQALRDELNLELY